VRLGGRRAAQIDRRVRGLKIGDRLVSLADPDARPIRKGKLGKPNEFGYVAQPCEVTENTRPGARGLILPAAHASGNTHQHEPGSRRTRRRRTRFRTGIEGRISHRKRRYGLRRAKLKGHQGMKIWTGWAILPYDLDTVTIRAH
jgi:IS5 family transposase